MASSLDTLQDPNVTLNVSAIEIYLNKCYDLLNNNAKVPISGYASVHKPEARKNIYVEEKVLMPDGRKLLPTDPEAKELLRK